MTSAVATGPRGGTRPLAIGLVMAVTMNATEAMAVVSTMPAVAADLHGDSLYGTAFSAYMLANLVALVLAGELADRHGPVRPFLLGVTTFAAGLVVAGAAPAMVVVVAGRALQGAGAGALASVAYVAIGRAWPTERQPRLFATLSAAWVVPSLVAPPLAGAVVSHVGWRWVFLGLLPLVPVLVALALPALRALPPVPPVAPRGADGPGPQHTPSRLPLAVLLAGGVGAAVSGLDARSPWLAIPLVVGGAALAWPALRRLLPPGTLRAAPGLPAAVAHRLCINLAFFGTDTFIPLAASRIHGASTFTGGVVITGAALTWTAGSAVAARTERSGLVVRTGFVAVLAGIVLVAPVVWAATPLWCTFLAWMLGGLGIGLVFTTSSVTAMALAPSGREGFVSSQLVVSDGLGFALASGVGGALVGLADRTGLTLGTALTTQFALAAGVAVIGFVLGGRAGVPRPVVSGPEAHPAGVADVR